MKKHIIITSLLSLTACASIVSGAQQSLSVTTSPSNAQCSLTSDKGTWFINNTPGTVTVHRALADMTVSCKKDELQGSNIAKSSIQPIEFGNILTGGIIGLAIDAMTGAGYDYPNPIDVNLKK